MKGIMFNEKYGLETAVLNGTKIRTWRADKQPRYKVGEIVAIKMPYNKVYDSDIDFFIKQGCVLKEDYSVETSILFSAGWSNKMFVKNELMPHQIKITAVKKCRLQDLTDDDCLKEGIFKYVIRPFFAYCFYESKLYATPKQAFADLINKLNGKGFWESNPDGYDYEFELVF